MQSFNLFDRIEELFLLYENSLNSFYVYKTSFEKEVYNDWEKEMLDMFSDMVNRMNEAKKCRTNQFR